MALHEIKPKTYIEFNIIKNSNNDVLITELKYIIGLGQFIILWSKTVSPEDMLLYCIEHNLTEYIWDYKIKDSTFYSSIDILIDDDQKLVDRFLKYNKIANYVERIE